MKNNKNRIVIATLAGFMLIIASTLFYESQNGAALFKKAGCINCHSFKGHGGAYGPDLTAVSHRRSFIWIMDQVKNPKTHNPSSRMPDHSYLSVEELFSIALYLQT
jgi:cbb3-type cytochrome oxidase cytochrome c subunit